MASPPRERVSDLISLVRDWVQFRRYERALKQAAKVGAEGPDASSSGWRMETTARNRTIGGIIIGSVILILLLVLFSCTVSGNPQSGPTRDPTTGESVLPSDPDTLDPEASEAPRPNMDLESAYKGGYFTNPDTGERYLVAQIDRAVKVPPGWICRPAKGLPTQQCLVALNWTADEAVEDQDEAAPDDLDRSGPESVDEAAPEVQPAPSDGSSASGEAVTRDEDSPDSTQPVAPKDNGRLVDWIGSLSTAGAFIAGIAFWLWPKRPERKRFQGIRGNLRGRAFSEELQRELLEHLRRAAEAAPRAGSAEANHETHRPGVDGGDLAPPV